MEENKEREPTKFVNGKIDSFSFKKEKGEEDHKKKGKERTILKLVKTIKQSIKNQYISKSY